MKRYVPKNLNGHAGNGQANGSSQSAPGGRPSKYKPEFAEQAKKLCLLGATDVEVADFFEVTNNTIYNWRCKYPEFSEAMKVGKQVADDRVERSLYQRACGYSHDSEKIFNDRGRVVRAPFTEHYPPDVTACIFWLKNRQPEAWRDKVVQEHTGKDGKAIEFSMADKLREQLDKLEVPNVVDVMGQSKNSDDKVH